MCVPKRMCPPRTSFSRKMFCAEQFAGSSKLRNPMPERSLSCKAGLEISSWRSAVLLIWFFVLFAGVSWFGIKMVTEADWKELARHKHYAASIQYICGKCFQRSRSQWIRFPIKNVITVQKKKLIHSSGSHRDVSLVISFCFHCFRKTCRRFLPRLKNKFRRKL